jgi:diaminohydroxyphosphoribosylaminopyrimidine deaminase/5-amino-6-(5-phosphoribosylamino)uracil reductase
VSDLLFMSRALALAERGRGRTSPNPMVGAVVVDADGVVVGRGFHEFAGGPHAEVHALNEAGSRSKSATLYCTLEPCTHVGRTGPCAPRVIASEIRRAVVAVEDPNPLVAGSGIAYLRDHGVELQVGTLGDQAERMNAAFFTRMRRGRPFVTLKAAMTLDGYVAGARGVRTRLTSHAANRAIHRERAEIDALAVGSGTILIDDPLLTPRGAYRYRPLVRVVFDRRLQIPPTARLFSTLETGPVIIISTPAAVRHASSRAKALAAKGAQIEPIATDDSSETFIDGALRRLSALDCNSLVVEGGPTLHDAFWRAGVVDRVQFFLAPHVAGPTGVPSAPFPIGMIAGMASSFARPIGEDVLIEGYVHGID